MELTAEIMQDLNGHTVSNGTIPAVNQRMAAQFKPVYEDLRKYLIQTEAPVHFDETGMNISGKLHWLHSASTKEASTFGPGRLLLRVTLSKPCSIAWIAFSSSVALTCSLFVSKDPLPPHKGERLLAGRDENYLFKAFSDISALN